MSPSNSSVDLSNDKVELTATVNLCHGKIGYSSKASAEKEALRLDDSTIRSYKCPDCKKWHLGHKTREIEIGSAKRNAKATSADHLRALETRPGPGIRIELPPLDIRTIQIKVVGDSPLICHRWSEKAKRMMLEKQMGKATSGREHKIPEEDYRESLYPMPDGNGYGVPTLAFKNAAVTACTSMGKAITKVQARQAFHVIGGLVKIEGTPRMRDDMVRVGMGTADIRFRGEFPVPWSCVLTIRYNARVLSDEQIANIINTSGFAVGICEWRPECNGESGLFHVE